MLLVRVASTAVVTQMLGGTRDQVINAVSNAWIDGGALAYLSARAEYGLAQELGGGRRDESRGAPRADRAHRRDGLSLGAQSAKTWGFQDVLFKGKPLVVPAGVWQLRDGKRAVQDLLPGGVSRANGGRVRDDSCTRQVRIASMRSSEIMIETQEPGVRIIDKTGPLANPADRDHCIQYMVAIPLIFGRLTAEDYEDQIAVDSTRRCTALAHDRCRRIPSHATTALRTSACIGNALQVFFEDRSATERVQVDYPIGHRKRRCRRHARAGQEIRKRASMRIFRPGRLSRSARMFAEPRRLDALPVSEFMAGLVKN